MENVSKSLSLEELVLTLTEEQKKALKAREKYQKGKLFCGYPLRSLAESFASINEHIVIYPKRKEFLLGQEAKLFRDICHYTPD